MVPVKQIIKRESAIKKPNIFKLLNKEGKGPGPQGGTIVPGKGGADPQKLIPGIKPGDPIPGKDPSQYNEPTSNEGKSEDLSYEQPSDGFPWGWVLGGAAALGTIGFIALRKKKKRK
jgi:hypothetical protein